MNHAEFQDEIIRMAEARGIWWKTDPVPFRSRGGWPDLVLLGPHGALFRELKTPGASLSPDQSTVGWLMKAAGLDWAVWWPMDIPNGNIERALDAIR